METEEKSFALSMKGTADLGKTLVQQAQEAYRRDCAQKVQDTVKGLLKSIAEQEKVKDGIERNIRVLRLRLAAIEEGKFEIDANGQLYLHDRDLAPLGIDH